MHSLRFLHALSARRAAALILAGAAALACALPTLARADDSETEPAINLDPVVITASRTDHPARTAPATVSLVTASDIAAAPSQDLLGAIRETTGLSLVGRGVGGRKVMLLRGMESRHSLILVDGRRISATDDVVGHSDFQYDWTPTSSIRQVEIIRGPMSALYGSEAMGGVVNIVTSPAAERWSGTIDAAIGAREDRRGGETGGAGVSLSGPLGRTLALRVSSNYRKSEDTPFADDPLQSELEGEELLGLNATLAWTPVATQRLEFTFDRVREDQWRYTTTTAGLPYRSNYDILRQQLGLRWRPQFGLWSGTVNAYETRTDVINETTAGVASSVPQYLTDRIADAAFSRPLGEHHVLTAGGEWRYEALEHPSFTGGEETAVHAALFAQDEWRLRDGLQLTAAARVDDHEFFDTEISPRGYMVWEASGAITLKGGYGGGFRAPTLKQISPEYRFVGPHTFVGNADLKPESSDSWELSAHFEPVRSFSVGVTVFRNDVEDLISTQVIANAGSPRGRVYQYVNLERARIDGLETEITWVPHRHLRLSAGHAWLDARDLTADLHLPGRPDHRVTASVRFAAVPERLQLTLGWEYNGEQWVRETSGESSMPGYSLINAGARWRIDGHHELILTLFNLADTDLADKSPNYGYAERGRSATVRWRLLF